LIKGVRERESSRASLALAATGAEELARPIMPKFLRFAKNSTALAAKSQRYASFRPIQLRDR
jgi:hypothetical protein